MKVVQQATVFLAVTLVFSGLTSCQKPNIVVIVADDYGWNDIGYHGSEIKTPIMDGLAAEGVKLENYYVQPLCTPSRSQLMSGRYQIHTGLQHRTIRPSQPSGLPLTDPTVAEKLKEVGYINHIIGKWHLGYFKNAYTPLRRGFDTFTGFYSAAEDYYTRYKKANDDWSKGIDFQMNGGPTNETYGEYSTHLYSRKATELINAHNQKKPMFLYLPFQSVHDPMQVPKEYEDMYPDIKDKKRRTYAGMVSALDEAIGNIVKALKQTGMWQNTVLVFTTDNGAITGKGGNNAPLRGQKGTYWEGGIRGVGFVSSPLIKKAGQISHELIHISDWFPTFLRLAGGSLNGTQVDGFDQWDTICQAMASPRNEILHNIDPLYPRKGKSVSKVFDTSVQASLRNGNWKILTGDPGSKDDWVADPRANPGDANIFGRALGTEADPQKNVYLFNIAEDPTEKNDLSEKQPDKVQRLLERLAFYNKTAVPVNYPDGDPKSNPKYFNFFVGPWM